MNNTSDSPLIRRYLRAGLGMFAISWMSASAYQLWVHRNESRDVCISSMKIVYVATKHLPPGMDNRDRIESLKRVLHEGFKPTLAEDNYLRGGRPSNIRPFPYFDVQWALLCVQDPKFPVKLLMSRSKTLDFAPSYQLLPNKDTMLYCPYHHHALLRDGSVVSR